MKYFIHTIQGGIINCNNYVVDGDKIMFWNTEQSEAELLQERGSTPIGMVPMCNVLYVGIN